MKAYTGLLFILIWMQTGNLMRAEERTCGHPGDVEFAEFNHTKGEVYALGSEVHYTCQTGYQMLFGSGYWIRRCMLNGWDGGMPRCEICSMPLGIKDEVVQNDQMTSSSVHRSFVGTNWHPYFGRLDETGLRNAWRAGTNDQLQWLQVDLGCSKTISGIITQGGGGAVSGTSYVMSFKVSYSDDGGPGTVIKDADGLDKIFPGNSDSDSYKKNMFESPITSRYVRVLPWTWEGHITLRIELLGCWAIPYGDWSDQPPQCKERTCGHPGDVEFAEFNHTKGEDYALGSVVQYTCQTGYQMLYGCGIRRCTLNGWDGDMPRCEVCSMPLGIKDEVVQNDQMTSSSVHRSFVGTNWHPYFGRLDETGLRNAWRAGTNDQLQWLQVDLGRSKTISGIITQGGGGAVSGTSYVTSFKVSYSDDGGPGTVIKDADGSDKIFPGNSEEQEEHKKNMFESPITSRYVRVLPWTWERHITLRIELLGCEATP